MTITSESLVTPATGVRPRFPIYVSKAEKHNGCGDPWPGHEIASFHPIMADVIPMDSYALHILPSAEPYAWIECPVGTVLESADRKTRLKVPGFRLGKDRLLTMRAIVALDRAHTGRDGLKLIFGLPVRKGEAEHAE
jgi:hypothetical protein